MTLGLLRSTITLRASGDATPEVAWRRYADLRKWSGWSPQITGVTAPGMRLAPGLRGTVHGPLGVRVPFVVTDVDELNMRWGWRVHVGPLRLQLDHSVTPHPDGSQTQLVVRSWTPAALAYAPLARQALKRLVRA